MKSDPHTESHCWRAHWRTDGARRDGLRPAMVESLSNPNAYVPPPDVVAVLNATASKQGLSGLAWIAMIVENALQLP